MTTTGTPSTPSVQDIRDSWLPHKERLNRVRDSHPTAVRFHRACSWLEESQRLDPVDQADQILIYQWIAFNAMYGQWDEGKHLPLADRESWQVFLGRVLELDAAGRIPALLKEHRGLTLAILGNAYLNGYFWHAPCSENAGKTGRGGRHRAESWYAQKQWDLVLEQVVERIYLLRCQLVHGAATLRSRLNRAALKHCTGMMEKLVPAFLQVWIDHGADEDWGIMCYPPVKQTNAPRCR